MVTADQVIVELEARIQQYMANVGQAEAKFVGATNKIASSSVMVQAATEKAFSKSLGSIGAYSKGAQTSLGALTTGFTKFTASLSDANAERKVAKFFTPVELGAARAGVKVREMSQNVMASNTRVATSFDAVSAKTSTSVEALNSSVDKFGAKISGIPDMVGRMQNPFIPFNQWFDNVNKQAYNLQFNLGNISSQFNDVVVTSVGGMNPLLIALQQGTQLSQAFAGQNLSEVAKGIGAAFGQLINPIGLVTIGVIAGGAALVQWGMAAFGAEGKANTLEDALSNLNAVQSGLSASTDILSMSVVDLYDKYGLYAVSVRNAAAALAEYQVAEAQASLTTALLESADALDRYSGAALAVGASGMEAQTTYLRNAAAVRAITMEMQVNEATAKALSLAFRDVQNAASFEDRVAALQRLDATMKSAGVSAEKLPTELRKALIEAREAEIKTAELKRTMDLAASAASAIGRNVPQGGWLDGAIYGAATLAATLWDAARAKAAVAGSLSIGATASTTGEGLIKDPRLVDMGQDTGGLGGLKIKSGGGGGGGGGKDDPRTSVYAQIEAFEEEKKALDELDVAYTRYETNLEILRKEEELLQALHKQGVPLTDEVRKGVRLLAESYVIASEAAKEARDRHEEFQQRLEDFKGTAENAFVGLISGAYSFREALSMLIAKLAEMAASQAFQSLWDVGLGSGAGSFMATLFGGHRAAGGPVATGKGYVVGENGPEWFSPNTAGSIMPNVPTAKDAYSSRKNDDMKLGVEVYVNDDGTLGAIARREGARGGAVIAAQVRKDIPYIVADYQKRRQ